MSNVQRHTQDGNNYIYYNAIITHNNNAPFGEPTPAILNETRLDVILDNPSQYWGTISRFEISGCNIPLCIVPIQPNQADINKTVWSFTLDFDGDSVQKYVEWIPSDSIVSVPQAPVGQFQNNTNSYYFCYDYYQIVDIFNNALLEAFTDLQTAVTPALDSSIAPFFGYNAETGLFTLYTDMNSNPSYNQDDTDHINIFFNQYLENMLVGFQYNRQDVGDLIGLDNVFIIKNRTNNIVILTADVGVENAYLVQEQQFIGLDYINSLRNIIIQTNMPISQEFSFPLNIGNQGGQSQLSTQSNFSLGLLSDYLIDTQQIAGGYCQKFVYNAEYPYRRFELLSNIPLKQINLSVLWVDQNQNMYPMYVSSGTSNSFKFMFTHKGVIP